MRERFEFLESDAIVHCGRHCGMSIRQMFTADPVYVMQLRGNRLYEPIWSMINEVRQTLEMTTGDPLEIVQNPARSGR